MLMSWKTLLYRQHLVAYEGPILPLLSSGRRRIDHWASSHADDLIAAILFYIVAVFRDAGLVHHLKLWRRIRLRVGTFPALRKAPVRWSGRVSTRANIDELMA